MPDTSTITSIDPLLRGYSKLDCTITDSSIWCEPHDVLRVWIALLAKCNRDGIVRISDPALALVCMIELERLQEIMEYLAAPDPNSRSSEFDGRRIEKVGGGYVILNYAKWREERSKKAAAARQARFRAKKKAAKGK